MRQSFVVTILRQNQRPSAGLRAVDESAAGSWRLPLTPVVPIVLLWLLVLVWLQIADVYDETTGLVIFHDSPRPLTTTLVSVWTSAIGLWRPLPTAVAASVLKLVPDRDAAWIAMRWINAAAFLAGLGILHLLLMRSGVRDRWRHAALAGGVLLSGSGILAGSWYASLFDVSVMILIAAGLWLAADERPVLAGLAIGLAFFCKENAVLGIVFLFALPLLVPVSRRTVAISSGLATSLGAAYFLLRSRRVAFGSEADMHQFVPTELVPTAIGFAQSFWTQVMKGDGPSILGIAVFVVGFIGLRGNRERAVLAALFGLSVGLYWGMLDEYQNGVLISHLNFIGRLHLVPVGLALLLLTARGRSFAVAAVVAALLVGGALTAHDHQRFQRSYGNLYELAAGTPGHLEVHEPLNPLTDPSRELRLGSFPEARWQLDVRTGALLTRPAEASRE
ncbi:MAG: hypothetical protein ABR524_08060 [Thermoanaerobaculia bacterium]